MERVSSSAAVCPLCREPLFGAGGAKAEGLAPDLSQCSAAYSVRKLAVLSWPTAVSIRSMCDEARAEESDLDSATAAGRLLKLLRRRAASGAPHPPGRIDALCEAITAQSEDTRACDTEQRSLLWWATLVAHGEKADASDRALVYRLLERGAAADTCDVHGSSLLCILVSSSSVDLLRIKELLEHLGAPFASASNLPRGFRRALGFVGSIPYPNEHGANLFLTILGAAPFLAGEFSLSSQMASAICAVTIKKLTGGISPSILGWQAGAAPAEEDDEEEEEDDEEDEEEEEDDEDEWV